MADPLLNNRTIERIINGYRSDIAELDSELAQAATRDEIVHIENMLAAKRYHLQRHIASLDNIDG